MPIQFRVVLTENTTDRIVQDNERGGAFYHDKLSANRPDEPTLLRAQDLTDILPLLQHERATEEEKALCLPIAKDLARGATPRAQDVQAVRDAKIAADNRQRDKEER